MFRVGGLRHYLVVEAGPREADEAKTIVLEIVRIVARDLVGRGHG